MKIALIGSSQYKDGILSSAELLRDRGHQAKTPAFDDHPELDELGICEYNRAMIEWADRVEIFWDQRSMGTIFDFGMVFALRKPIHIVYIEPKTFKGVMEKYERGMNGANSGRSPVFESAD